MKANTGSAMKPNSFRLIPESCAASPECFPKLNSAGRHNGRQPPLEREDQLASEEIVRVMCPAPLCGRLVNTGSFWTS